MLTTNYKADLAKQFYLTFEKDEVILWSDRPRLKVFLLNSCLKIFYHQLAFLGTFVFFGILLSNRDDQWDVRGFIGVVAVFAAIESATVIREALRLRKTTYLITNFSVLILIDSQISFAKCINIRNIETKEIKRTIIDKKYQTSAIYLFSGETFDNDGVEEKKYDILHGITDAAYVLVLLE
ncbi:MAG: hypothetical protein DI535_08010 [Citrobacter freundii]|nr:MAG: hypothetical protein DI535_08010 [Citrobacter freundii]